VCINKMDTIDWDSDEYHKTVDDFTKKIKRFRFKHIMFIPISAYHGDNIIDKYDNDIASCSFMDALTNITIEPKRNKQIELTKKLVKGKFLFYQIDSLITNGFICKVHTKDQVYDGTIIKLRNGNFPFVTEDNSNGKLIDVILKVDTEEHIDSNIVLRNGNNTIAIGVIA
jgi:translation elongation factor EF-1alpha